MTDVTRILNAIGLGDAKAADELLPLIYEELRVLAAQKLSREAPGQVIVSQQDGTNWLAGDSSDGVLMTDLKSAGRQSRPLTSMIVITDGVWHRLGLVWDGSNRILYVDDIEVARDTQTNLIGSTGGMHLGAGKGLEPGTFWSGLIDDIHIYDRVVTP